MPYINCIVASCETRRKPNTDKSSAVRCFSFPKDPALKEEWLNLCKVKDYNQARDSARKVCMKHFKEDDFVDGLKARLLNLQPRRLKKDAVPSLHLGYETKEERQDVPKKKNLKVKLIDKSHKTVKAKKESNGSNNGSSKEYLSKLVAIAPKGIVIASQDNSERLQYTNFVEQQNYFIKPNEIPLPEQRYKILQHDNTIFKKRIFELMTHQDKLKHQIKKLEAKVKKDEQAFADKVKEVFAHTLTPNQVDMLLGKKVRVCWTEDEFLKAYTLQHLSKKAYFYVKDTLNYPLPGMSTLKHWASKMGAEMLSNDDDENIPPMPKRIRLTLEKIKKGVDINKVVETDNGGNDSYFLKPANDTEPDSELFSDINEESKNDYCDTDDDSEKNKLSNGEYNVNIEVANINENFEHDDEMYEEIDYLNVNDDAEDNYIDIYDTDPGILDKGDDECSNDVNDHNDNDCLTYEQGNNSDVYYKELVLVKFTDKVIEDDEQSGGKASALREDNG